jgi:molybdenum cofactor guanylyltransferase
VTGIILAGGENSRMGLDKAFLDFSGKPLIERILSTLRSVCGSIIIVTNSPAKYAVYGVTVVADFFNKRGPLTGIYSGLRESGEEYNFVVACDMPYLNKDLMAYMAGLSPGYDVVVPVVGDQVEPLHAIYRRSLLQSMEGRISRNDQRVRMMFPMLHVRYVGQEEIARFDPERKSFKNLNTPQEYEEAVCADWECRS